MTAGREQEYDWIEVRAFDGTTHHFPAGCRHRRVIPVESVTGEIVAGLCLVCDTQMPADLITDTPLQSEH